MLTIAQRKKRVLSTLFARSLLHSVATVSLINLQIMVMIDPMPYDVRINESVIRLSIYLLIVDTKVNTCLSSPSYLAMG